jgi:hypothetical protein
MKRNILVIFIVIAVFAAVPASAQIGNLTKKITEKTKQEKTQKPAAEKAQAPEQDPGTPGGDGYKDSEFLFMGRNDMEGAKIAEMRACVVGASDQAPPPLSKGFVAWITNISEVAALRSFNGSTCQVVAFRIDEHPAYKYKNIDSLTETAQGNSIYKVEAGKLLLLRKVEAAQFFIVVVPDHNKPGLKLADLRMCGYPDTIKLFRRKVNSVSNCHDQKQKLYVFEKYKRYPGPMQTGSVIFDAQEFETLKKQGKFRGLVMYKLSGEDLSPVR